MSSLWPIGILFLLFLGGCGLAGRIFHVRPAKKLPDTLSEIHGSPMDTDSGPIPIGDPRAYPPDEQRRIRLREQVRTLSGNSPESAASVIKAWLREG